MRVATGTKSRQLQVVVGVLVLLAMIAAVKFWPRHQQAPPPPTPINVIVDAVPWGTVVEVKPENGPVIPVNKVTPLLVAVPPGNCAIRMKGPDGAELVGTVRVEPGQPVKYMHQFEPIDVEKLLESYR